MHFYSLCTTFALILCMATTRNDTRDHSLNISTISQPAIFLLSISISVMSSHALPGLSTRFLSGRINKIASQSISYFGSESTRAGLASTVRNRLGFYG